MDLRQEVHALLRETGPGRMLSTAYDTAWVARLAEWGEPIGEQALTWLRENQLADGSWGAGEPYYHHDRLICTLAAITALARRGDVRDHNRLYRSLIGLDTAIRGIRADIVGETIGFEMIAPVLSAEARALGAVRRSVMDELSKVISYYDPPDHALHGGRRADDDFLERLNNQRQAKLSALPAGKINRYVTVAFSAEMAGTDGIRLFDLEHLQEANGSIGFSPSATAYYALYLKPGDEAALSYLRYVMNVNRDGGIPDVAPFDIFEPAWVLWNLALAGPLDDETLALCKPRLDFLETSWLPGEGVGFAADYAPKDSDGTSFTYQTLAMFGRQASLQDVLSYEKEEYFRCFALESNPSISANVHVLGALRQAGLPATHPTVQKVITFLKRKALLKIFWLDKWHVSPYYPTTHAIIEAAGYADDLVENAVAWIMETQRPDGSWGYYVSTAEETAYCLQALIIWKRHGKAVSETVLKRGLAWLAENKDKPYQPLWIGKCLYCPALVVRSAILSALMLGAQEDLQ